MRHGMLLLVRFKEADFSDYSIVYEYQEGIRPGVEMEQEN